MKQMQKKLVALVLALVMVCSMIASALAEEVATVTDLQPVEESAVTSAPVEETPDVTEEPAPEATEEPAPEATEEPAPEVTEDPAPEATEESAPEATEEPAPEATEEPAPEVTEEPAPEATEEPEFVFTGKVGVRMLNTGDIYLGDTVVLMAVVLDANAEYTISWEVCKDGLNWETIQENADHYTFVVTEENAGYAYRAVLTVAE